MKCFLYLVTSCFLLATVAQDNDADQAVEDQYPETAEIFFDNSLFHSGYALVEFEPLKDGHTNPDLSDTAEYEGYDWTQEFPSSKLGDFKAHLRVVDNVPFLEDSSDGELVPSTTNKTAVSTVTYNLPQSLMDGDKVKPVHPSWLICRQIWIATKPGNTQGDHQCGFIRDQCRKDWTEQLTRNWVSGDEVGRCTAHYVYSPPKSCLDSIGNASTILYRMFVPHTSLRLNIRY